MRSSSLCLLVLTAVLSLESTSSAIAEEPAPIVMNVGEMCGGCVKKITARLSKMPEVATIQCRIPKKSVTVTPKAGGVSSKALWEAMVEIGKTPTKLVDASGTHTSPPQN